MAGRGRTLIQQTVETLRKMRLTGMAEALLSQARQPDSNELSFEERIGLLVDYEWTYRQNRRLARLLKQAKLRMPACMEDIDYQHPRGLDRALMRSLANCQWLYHHQNVLISGPTGVGKTFLACALANQACRHGFSARYYRTPRLLTELGIARGDGSYPKLMNQLAKVNLLVLDDWGLATLTAAESRDLLEVIEDRCQSHSTIVASQLPIEDWHTTMGDPTVADAVLDRLVHNAHKLILKGEFMRKLKASPSTQDEKNLNRKGIRYTN